MWDDDKIFAAVDQAVALSGEPLAQVQVSNALPEILITLLAGGAVHSRWLAYLDGRVERLPG